MILPHKNSRVRTLKTAKDSEYGSSIEVTPDGELMTNYQTYLPVAPGSALKAVEDNEGNPLIFSIGGDKQLYIIGRDPNAANGWTQINLLADMPNTNVATVEVVQAENGQVFLCAALSPADDATQSTLYVSAPMPETMTDAAWQDMASHWSARQAVVVSGTGGSSNPQDLGTPLVTEITMGPSGVSHVPAIIVAALVGNETVHYLVNGNVADDSWSWKTYPMPENTATILSMSIGKTGLGYGTFVLGTNLAGDSTTLTFTTFVNQYGQTYNAIYPVPQGASQLQAVADPQHYNYTQLFVAGTKGVSWFPSTANGGKDAAVSIFDASITGAVYQLQVRQTATNICIWYSNTVENLYYVQTPQANTASAALWSEPLALRGQVTQLAAFNNLRRAGSDICFVTGGSELGYMYQDDLNSVWSETDIPLQDDGNLMDFTTYTAQAQFKTTEGLPLNGKTVRLTASQEIYTTVNGNLYHLSPAAPVDVTLDSTGVVSILVKITDISGPIYTIDADFLAEPYVLNPADKVIAGIGTIKTGSDLKNAKRQDGTPLVLGDYSDQVLDFGAYSMTQLSTMIDQLPADGSMQADEEAVVAKQTPTAQLDALWGMHLGAETPMLYRDVEVGAHLLPAMGLQAQKGQVNFKAFDWIEGVVGDVMQAVQTGLEKVTAFLVKVTGKLFEFFIQIGKRIIRLVIKCIVQAVKIAAWILDELFGIDLMAFLQWLGFLFSWGDIVNTHKVYANVANQSINLLQAKMVGAEDAVRGFFRDLKRKLKDTPTLPDDLTTEDLQSLLEKMQASMNDEQQSGLDFTTGSVGGNFSNYQMEHSGMTTGEAGDLEGPDGPIETFINDIMLPTLTKALGLLKTLMEDFAKIIQGFIKGTMTIGEAIKLIVGDTLYALLDLCEVLAIGMIELANSLLESFQNLINTNIQIPFLTALFKWVSGDDEMTFLNGIALLAAIPSTMFYKIVAGETPFDDKAFGLIDGDWETVFATLTGEPMQQAAKKSRVSTESEHSEAQVLYTEVGGITGLSASVFSAVLGAVNAFSKGQVKFTSQMYMISSLVSIASSFPVDDDETIRDIKYGTWGLKTFDLLVSLVGFMSPRSLATEVNAAVLGPYKLLSTTVNFACDISVLVLKAQKDRGEDLAWDIEGFVQDCADACAGYATGISYIDPDPVTQAVEQTIAALCALDSVALGAIRDGFNIYDRVVYDY